MTSARLVAAGLALLFVVGLPTAHATDVVEANLEAVGRTDLGTAGPFGDVAVVGTTAVVASDACPATATVVDVKDPKRPRVVSVIALPPGTAAADVDGTGDLVAIALAPSPCDGAADPGGVAYYDLADPSAPRLLSRTAGCRTCGGGPRSVSLAQRDDSRVIAVRVDGSDGVAVDDVTDAAHVAPLGRWAVPTPATPAGCPAGGRAVSAILHDDGEGALVVLSDGRIYDLDLSDPSAPSGAGGEPPQPGRSTFGAVMPVGRRTLAIVADEGGPGCADAAGGPGLRVLELDHGTGPRELDTVRFTTPAAPGRLVASGELAYVAWDGDGLRIVDLGQVKPRTVAQFVPPAGDVVAVALLAEHVVVTDRTSGLYVLRRPDEGGARSSFWSELAGLLPYLPFPLILAAWALVPRLAARGAPAGSGAPVPAPARVPRRRASRRGRAPGGRP